MENTPITKAFEPTPKRKKSPDQEAGGPADTLLGAPEHLPAATTIPYMPGCELTPSNFLAAQRKIAELSAAMANIDMELKASLQRKQREQEDQGLQQHEAVQPHTPSPAKPEPTAGATRADKATPTFVNPGIAQQLVYFATSPQKEGAFELAWRARSSARRMNLNSAAQQEANALPSPQIDSQQTNRRLISDFAEPDGGERHEADHSQADLSDGSDVVESFYGQISVPFRTRLKFEGALSAEYVNAASHLEELFTTPFWLSEMRDLLEKQHEATLGGLARHLLMVVKGNNQKCPVCFVPQAGNNLLRHLNLHLTQRQRQIPTYSLGRRDELGNKDGACCFVAGCKAGPWVQRAGHSSSTQLRQHLLTHSPSELAPYGINLVLLQDDVALASGGLRKSRVEVLESMDGHLVGVLFHALHDSHRLVYQAMLGRVNCLLQAANGTHIEFLEPRLTIEESQESEIEVVVELKEQLKQVSATGVGPAQ